MAHPIVYSWLAADTVGVANTQTLGAAGSLILDGTLLIASSMRPYISFNGVSRTVSLTSVNNLGGVNFTITGYLNGTLQSETRVGPNNNTVYTTALFDTVTSITTSAAAAAVSAGSGTTGRTHWYDYNYHATVIGFTAQAVVTGTITYSFETTLDDVNTVAAPTVATPIAGMTAATTTQYAVYNNTMRYCCIHITAATDGALAITFLQQGIT